MASISLAALNAEIVAQFRDTRLAGDPDKNGKLRPRSNNTVRLKLALLGHLFTVAIKEWGISLPFNPVFNIRLPAQAATPEAFASEGGESSEAKPLWEVPS